MARDADLSDGVPRVLLLDRSGRLGRSRRGGLRGLRRLFGNGRDGGLRGTCVVVVVPGTAGAFSAGAFSFFIFNFSMDGCLRATRASNKRAAYHTKEEASVTEKQRLKYYRLRLTLAERKLREAARERDGWQDAVEDQEEHMKEKKP